MVLKALIREEIDFSLMMIRGIYCNRSTNTRSFRAQSSLK